MCLAQGEVLLYLVTCKENVVIWKVGRIQDRTEQNIYFIDVNCTVSCHTYMQIITYSQIVTIDVYMI